MKMLEIRKIDSTMASLLATFFEVVKSSGDDRFFHPHPFDEVHAHRIANYGGQDLYYAVIDDEEILGYGMLRGWDEGYSIPSLGIIIHPNVRGSGLGKMLMLFLHAAALRRGVRHIRLTVYPENTPALTLYRKLGYSLVECEASQLVGVIDL